MEPGGCGKGQMGRFRENVFYQPKKAVGVEAKFKKKNSKPKQRPSVTGETGIPFHFPV
jgi:hypothetical protein